MRKLLLLSTLLAMSVNAMAQTKSNADFQIPYPKPHAQLLFKWADKGKPTPIEWGFDLAWLSEDNLRHGIMFSGKEVVDMMRVSYMPSGELADGKLTSEMLSFIKKRADLVKKYCKPGVGVNINDDHATVDKWYNGSSLLDASNRAKRWAQVIDLTAQKFQSYGLNIVSISPFNEPDYGWDQGYNNTTRKTDFLNICKELRNNPAYDGIRLCGGNTLNCDKAFEWWNFLKGSLDEGNTHQLAGDFNHYAEFFTKVREAGQHATADELHNTMEAMVGVEYGMQTGIWWGSADYARGQFMKATYQGNPGDRLGYAEHRANWTCATVYRQPEGNVQAFIGSSERQAVTTDFEFVAIDRDVYFKGQGPMRHFVMQIPGGTSYQVGQTNAETVFDIQSGEDVQPYINGTYRIVNKYCNRTGKGKYLGFSTNPGTGWKQLQQNLKPAKDSNEGYTQWVVKPVDSRIGGDYSYYDIRMAGNESILMDILNWSLNDGESVGAFPGGFGNNEQWYLQYAGDGWFYIRSKHNNMALACTNTSAGTSNTVQQTFKEGEEKQMWRFIDAKAEYDRIMPATPTRLEAVAQPASILLSWNGVEDDDLDSYDILRTEKGTEDWNTIARGLKDTCFIDNTALDGKMYLYAVRSMDNALNRSEKSTAVEAEVTGEKALICALDFEESLKDASVNANHAIMGTDPTYNNKSASVKRGDTSLELKDGAFVQLPSTVSSHDNLTIACWARRTSTTGTWERIFDFGNGQDQYMFLTPSNGSRMRLALKNGGEEETLDVSALTTTMKHIAVTIDGDNGIAKIYINGELKATNENLTIKPSDIQGVCNYIGRSQFINDPEMKGVIDDFRIYNYALTSEEIMSIYDPENHPDRIDAITDAASKSADTYNLSGRKASKAERGIKIKKSRKSL